MKKFLVAIFGSALILGACGGADDPVDEAPADEEAPVEEEVPQEDPVDDGDADAGAGEVVYDAARAQETYEQNCLSCHGGEFDQIAGATLQGGEFDHIVSAIQEGQPGMPAGLVEGEEAENLAAWLAANAE
ncbi:c-type cytochrome [Desertibacillus haloalkaliphilus]|uniref:c-type cytochrome n=1 Tax=Desertibacillus haloalkaliphilus TaxID=1328930 RepID=UPI001C25CC5F|nr:cytochrome c [Desertibacillus haloalkaliphilus]MBU8908691.1 cytochrome c [Desertibacillus haloalkaliphilus]